MGSVDVAPSDIREGQLAARIAAAAPACDRDAETALYGLLAPRVRRYGLRHLRDEHAADDLMQQVMVLTLEKLRSGAVDAPAQIVSFVLGTCRRVVIEQFRVHRRREDLLQHYGGDLPIADLHVAPRLDQARVADCLERLAERERTVLVLSFYEELPAEAVGRSLGLTAGNVRVIRHRGIDKLRRCVGADRVAA